MSIKAYVGRMGSGKSYEVVTEVIYPALCRGRRVVSNIAGLNRDAMLDAFEHAGGDPDKFGELVQVSHEKVVDPFFWRTDKDEAENVDSFIAPGDLVALDEIWRFWHGFGPKDAEGAKRPDRVMNFFRMHRHFTHAETGVACDMVLITQDAMDIARAVRAVIEETYRMTKLTALGSASRYRVDIYQGGKTTGKPLRSLQRKYNAALFGFYQSHSQKKEGAAEAVEENIDDRGNLLKGVMFKLVIPVMLLVGSASVWFVWQFFHRPPKKDAQTQQEAAGAVQGQNGAKVSPEGQKPQVEAEWRSAGILASGGRQLFVLQKRDGSVRLLEDVAAKYSAAGIEVQLPEGGFAVSWTKFPREPEKPGLLP